MSNLTSYEYHNVIIYLNCLLFQTLYKQGARTFWIHNTGPIGCLPISVIYTPAKTEDLDQIGCLKSHNEVAQEFNRQLKEKVSSLRSQLSGAALTYVDIYAAKYKLISEAAKLGKLALVQFLFLSK